MEGPQKGWRTFELNGFEILVGRAARDNDHLTFKIARPQDTWLHASGFSATLGRTDRDDPVAGRDKEFSYLKLGYKVGKHAVSLDFGRGEDQAAAADESDFFGVGYVYTPMAWADIYGLLKQHQLDRPGASFDDISVLMVGTRLKF